eukprot:scaffold20981_cov75-Skeletonema_dohrnii-CCMP3373.AAC.1
MAEAHEADEVFVYMGEDQEVPRYLRRVRIHRSVIVIPRYAFYGRDNLIDAEFHDGIERIEKEAFYGCTSLRGSIKLLGVRVVEIGAFDDCAQLKEVEFGDKLETIDRRAFDCCRSLTNAIIPSVRYIGIWAFSYCEQLTDLDLPETLETIDDSAFEKCRRLRRITMPLKDNMIGYNAFIDCPNLKTVGLVRGIHKTVASLHLESWRNEMKGEINRINQVLSDPDSLVRVGGITAAIQTWMNTVTRCLDCYKVEHKSLLQEAATLLELALWKNILDYNEGALEKESIRTTRGRRKRGRKEICVTSGASVVIKNVLPFLQLE